MLWYFVILCAAHVVLHHHLLSWETLDICTHSHRSKILTHGRASLLRGWSSAKEAHNGQLSGLQVVQQHENISAASKNKSADAGCVLRCSTLFFHHPSLLPWQCGFQFWDKAQFVEAVVCHALLLCVQWCSTNIRFKYSDLQRAPVFGCVVYIYIYLYIILLQWDQKKTALVIEIKKFKVQCEKCNVTLSNILWHKIGFYTVEVTALNWSFLVWNMLSLICQRNVFCRAELSQTPLSSGLEVRIQRCSRAWCGPSLKTVETLLLQ